MDTPDLAAVRVFMAIARSGGVTTGAARVGLTRSAAGKALTRLEERLGTRLMNRTTRRNSLTAEGQLFLDRCEHILADLEEAEALVRQDAAVPSGTLRLTLPETFGREHVMPALHRFLADHPGLTAEASITDRFVDIVEEGFDLAIRCGGSRSDTRLISRVVARSTTVVCAAPGYLSRVGMPQDFADIADRQRLTLGTSGVVRPWRLTSPDGVERRLGGAGRLHLDSGTALRAATLAGLGVSCLPMFLVEADLAAGRLVELFADHVGEQLLIHAIYPHRRHLASRVRMFVDRLSNV